MIKATLDLKKFLEEDEALDRVIALRTQLFNFARRYEYLNRADTEDAFQETCTKISDKAKYGRKSILTKTSDHYIHTVFRHECDKIHRWKKSRREILQDTQQMSEALLRSLKENPLERMLTEEEKQLCRTAHITYLQVLSGAMQKLKEKKPRTWQAITLYEIKGKSYKAIANQLNIKLANLKMEIYRGRKKIEEYILNCFNPKTKEK